MPQHTTEVNPNTSKTVVMGAKVTEAYAQEYELIQKHRGDATLSDTVRAALEEFRQKHWREQIEPRQAREPQPVSQP